MSPWKAETNFKSKIITGQKKHTFRLGDRWSAGRRIDLWDESPRNTRKNPKPSHIELPLLKAEYWNSYKDKNKKIIERPLAAAVEDFTWTFKEVDKKVVYELHIGGLPIDQKIFEQVALNDGFDQSQLFFQWFNWSRKKKKTDVLIGQVIHWTKDTIYDPSTADIFNRASHLKSSSYDK